MNYRLYRHPEVEEDLLCIVDMLLEFAGPDVAERKFGEIEKSIRNLSQTPHIGSIRDDIHPGLRAIPTARKGVVVFVVDDERQEVFIVGMGYAGSDWIGSVLKRMGIGGDECSCA